MAPSPKHHITAAEAVALLQAGAPIRDSYVSGDLRIETGDVWEQAVLLENCLVENFSGAVTPFQQSVSLINCHFKQCQFVFTYFLGGLLIDNCLFDSYLDLQAGGHNQLGKPVIITGNVFADFVNFFDCWYEGEVIITDNHFLGGTNLLGRPHNIPVTFDVAPLLSHNSGQLAIEGEDSTHSLDG